MQVSKTVLNRIYKKFKAKRDKLDDEYDRKLAKIDSWHGRELEKAIKKVKALEK